MPISTVLGPNISLIPTELLKKNINSLESKMFPPLCKITGETNATTSSLDESTPCEPKSENLTFIENLKGSVANLSCSKEKKTSHLYDNVNKLSNTSSYEPRKYKCPNCSITYKYKQAFKEHLLYDCKAAFTKPMFVCPYCQKIGQKQFLREHIIQEHLM